MSTSLLNLLIAYPYMSDAAIKAVGAYYHNTRFVLDSGAFTAWKAGKPIQLDDYCRFIERLPFKPWRYFTLDVIGDPEATLKNYETMLKRGFNPVPIFTRGEHPSVLDDYYKTSEVVGIGGLVGTPKNKAFVNGIMQHVGKRKVHWLGFTSHPYLLRYKPYMCDSSSWESGARYGSLRLYLGSGKFVAVKRTELNQPPKINVQRAISNLGFNWLNLRYDASWRGGASLARLICAASAVAYSADVEKNLGTYLFNACAAIDAIEQLIDAHKLFLVRKGK